MKYDLHVHSNISDGKVSREEIIKHAIENKLECIAFTEHNDFVSDDKCILSDDLIFINGIEFDTFYDKSFHTLCYFGNKNNVIDKLINKYRENSNDRSEELIKRISEQHKIDIDLINLQTFCNKKYITKRDIIDWLIFNKYAQSVHEASYKFTGKTATSYVPKYSFDFKDVAEVIKNIDGKLVLAHPSSLKYNLDELEVFIKRLIDLGLDGIEVVNSSKIEEIQTQLYKLIANNYNLLMSGGSDFHSFDKDKLGVQGDESKKLIKTFSNFN